MAVADRPRHVREPQEKRARLIVGATTVFGRDGYSRARILDICRSAGVSVGTFYEHFESKADLLLHIAELEDERVQPIGPTTRDELERAMEQLVGSPLAGIARAWLEAIEVEPALRVADARLRGGHLDRYAAWVRDARAQRGGDAPRIDERATARAVIALLKEALTATYEPALPGVADLARAAWYLLFAE